MLSKNFFKCFCNMLLSEYVNISLTFDIYEGFQSDPVLVAVLLHAFCIVIHQVAALNVDINYQPMFPRQTYVQTTLEMCLCVCIYLQLQSDARMLAIQSARQTNIQTTLEMCLCVYLQLQSDARMLAIQSARQTYVQTTLELSLIHI